MDSTHESAFDEGGCAPALPRACIHDAVQETAHTPDRGPGCFMVVSYSIIENRSAAFHVDSVGIDVRFYFHIRRGGISGQSGHEFFPLKRLRSVRQRSRSRPRTGARVSLIQRGAFGSGHMPDLRAMHTEIIYMRTQMSYMAFLQTFH